MSDASKVAVAASPVTIVHIDLAEVAAAEARVLGPNYLCIFWSDDAPVGQVYGTSDPGERVRLDALAGKAGLAGRSDPKGWDRPQATPSTVSVIVCTRDRPKELSRCLASLPRQSRAPDQILVVDNGSGGDETRQAALAAGVDYVRENRPGLDIARNTGARRATGEIVAYTDDDVVLHPRWLERLAGAFDQEHIWAVTGLVLPAELETEAQCIFERHWGFGRGFARRDHGPAFYHSTRRRGCPVWEIGAGANMAFRRRAFDEVGSFDERLDVGAAGCSGDSELWYRILHQGGTCRYEPSAVVFHHHRKSYDALARQIRAYMSGHTAALLVQHERTGDLGNLRRLLLTLPRRYAGQFKRRALHGRDHTTCLLNEEVAGCVAGVLYYLKAPRPNAPRHADETALSALRS